MAETNTTGTDPQEGKRPFRITGALVIVLVLIIAVVIMITRGGGDDRRHPSPTPTNENVHEIAP